MTEQGSVTPHIQQGKLVSHTPLVRQVTIGIAHRNAQVCLNTSGEGGAVVTLPREVAQCVGLQCQLLVVVEGGDLQVVTSGEFHASAVTGAHQTSGNLTWSNPKRGTKIHLFCNGLFWTVSDRYIPNPLNVRAQTNCHAMPVIGGLTNLTVLTVSDLGSDVNIDLGSAAASAGRSYRLITLVESESTDTLRLYSSSSPVRIAVGRISHSLVTGSGALTLGNPANCDSGRVRRGDSIDIVSDGTQWFLSGVSSSLVTVSA